MRRSDFIFSLRTPGLVGYEECKERCTKVFVVLVSLLRQQPSDRHTELCFSASRWHSCIVTQNRKLSTPPVFPAVELRKITRVVARAEAPNMRLSARVLEHGYKRLLREGDRRCSTLVNSQKWQLSCTSHCVAQSEAPIMRRARALKKKKH